MSSFWCQILGPIDEKGTLKKWRPNFLGWIVHLLYWYYYFSILGIGWEPFFEIWKGCGKKEKEDASFSSFSPLFSIALFFDSSFIVALLTLSKLAPWKVFHKVFHKFLMMAIKWKTMNNQILLSKSLFSASCRAYHQGGVASKSILPMLSSFDRHIF